MSFTLCRNSSQFKANSKLLVTKCMWTPKQSLIWKPCTWMCWSNNLHSTGEGHCYWVIMRLLFWRVKAGHFWCFISYFLTPLKEMLIYFYGSKWVVEFSHFPSKKKKRNLLCFNFKYCNCFIFMTLYVLHFPELYIPFSSLSFPWRRHGEHLF